MKISGIYIIQSIIKPERKYIGSSININRRKYLHFWDLQRGKHKNMKLQRHFNKYGIDDLVFSVLIGCDKETLLAYEQFYIDALNPYFNLCPIAGNSLGVKRSEEFKRKISEANTGKKRSKEVCEQMSKVRKGRKNVWAIGNKNNVGRKASKETREKLRIAHLGQQSGFRNKKHSDEAKEKNRIAHLGKRKIKNIA
jgi:group I intron endonuclease